MKRGDDRGLRWRGTRHPLQGSCLEKPTDRGGWRATVCGAAKGRTRLKLLSTEALYRDTWALGKDSTSISVIDSVRVLVGELGHQGLTNTIEDSEGRRLGQATIRAPGRKEWRRSEKELRPTFRDGRERTHSGP